MTDKMILVPRELLKALMNHTAQNIPHSESARFVYGEADALLREASKEAEELRRYSDRVKELERFVEAAFEAHPNLDLDVAAIAAEKREGES